MTTEQPDPRRARERHVARSARILSTGLSATAILGITAAFGAAERLQSTTPQPVTDQTPGIAGVPSALAPLGSGAPVSGGASPTVVSQLPSPEGTITLPTGSPAPVQAATSPRSIAAPQKAASLAGTAGSPAAPQVAQASPTSDSAATTSDVAAATPAPTMAAPVASAPATSPATSPATTPATVAPIAPAEPPVQLTLPPPPSNGSSGGSR